MSKYYVYRFLNDSNEIIYVGKTGNFINRMKQHFSEHNGHLPKECYDSVNKIEYIELNHPIDMTIYELYYISKYRPKYNTNDILDDVQSDIASIVDFELWNVSNFLEENKQKFKDIETLNLDVYIGKYMVDNNSKRLSEYLGDKYLNINIFYNKLKEYGLVGKFGDEFRFYTDFAVNRIFLQYGIKYKITSYKKKFDYERSRAYWIYEIHKI